MDRFARLLSRVTASVVMFAVVACGSGDDTSSTSGSGSGSGSTSSGAGGGAAGPAPLVHRATSEACTAERPAGVIYDPSATGSECQADADCKAGANGRCVQDLSGPTRCSYDACATDEDCGGGQVCACRNEPNHYANACYHGDCRIDADCAGGGGYCSPSAVTLSTFCTTGIPQGSFGYFCHSPGDECVDDADCDASVMQMCFFNTEKLHYSCFDLLCVN